MSQAPLRVRTDGFASAFTIRPCPRAAAERTEGSSCRKAVPRRRKCSSWSPLARERLHDNAVQAEMRDCVSPPLSASFTTLCSLWSVSMSGLSATSEVPCARYDVTKNNRAFSTTRALSARGELKTFTRSLLYKSNRCQCTVHEDADTCSQLLRLHLASRNC